MLTVPVFATFANVSLLAQDGRLEADLREKPGHILGRLAFAGALVVAAVGGIDPDEVAAQARDLVLSGDVAAAAARGGWSLCHHPMVALSGGEVGIGRSARGRLSAASPDAAGFAIVRRPVR